MSTLAAAVAASLVVAGCRATLPTTVVLVRHAERPPGQDPDLNDAGRARAESLSVALLRTHVDAIIHTQFRRTAQTAQPLAARTGLTPIVVGATASEAAHAREVVGRIGRFKGKTVVYVGHSNTVPAVIAALGFTPAPAIADSEYQQLFIVRKRGASVDLVRAKY